MVNKPVPVDNPRAIPVDIPKAIPSVSPRFGNKPPIKPSEIEGKPIQNIFEIKKPMTPVIAEPSPRFGQKSPDSVQVSVQKQRPWSRQSEDPHKKAIEEIKQRGKQQVNPMRKFEVIWG